MSSLSGPSLTVGQRNEKVWRNETFGLESMSVCVAFALCPVQLCCVVVAASVGAKHPVEGSVSMASHA